MSSIFLTKDNAGVGSGAALTDVTKLRFGASWDASTRGRGGFMGKISKKGGVDIDLIGVLMHDSTPLKFAGLDNPNPLGDGSFVHSGDNQTGHGDGDDEVIDADLSRIPLTYTHIIFVASVFKGPKSNLFGSMAAASGDKGFQGANNVEFRMYNTSVPGSVAQDAHMMPPLDSTKNTCVLSKISRTSRIDQGAAWKIEIIEEMVDIEQDNMMSLFAACKGR